MLPTALLDVSVSNGIVVPHYLTTRDATWVRALQDVLEASIGRTRTDSEDRIERAHLPGAGWRQRQAMTRLLLRLHGWQTCAPCDPVRARQVVFDTASEFAGAPRDSVLTRASGRLAADPTHVEQALYADLPGQRILRPMILPISPADMTERYNLALLQGLLFLAEKLRVRVRDGVRQVVRFAKLQRLLVEVSEIPGEMADVGLDLSGPLSLLRVTTKYGHAMSRWLPALTRAAPWSLEARCRLRGEHVTLRANHLDPIGTTHVLPQRFDSRLEERFFRDFAKLGSPWTILREASPVTIEGRIACPDFTLVDAARGLSVVVEIVGFWTPSYIAAKRHLLARLPADKRWLLCVDANLVAGEEGFVSGSETFVFRRRIHAADFLAFLECAVLERARITMTCHTRRVMR